jgi:hypothetical protein
VPDWDRFSELESGGNAYSRRHDVAAYLAEAYGAVTLDRTPAVLTDVPENKTLVWVVEPDHGDGQLAYYVWDESGYSRMLDDYRPALWLLMDRAIADRLVPVAARRRAEHDTSIAEAADRAAHPDNLLPVARISRLWARNNAETLLRYAAIFRGERPDHASRTPLTDEGLQRIMAADFEAIGRYLEQCASANWVAVLEPQWQPDGPLPPFPGPAPDTGQPLSSGD